MKHLMLLVLPALALAACGKSNDGGANGQANAAEAGKPKSIEQVAEEMKSAPKMKPGEWETSVQIVKFDMPDAPPQMKEALQQSMAQANNSSKSCVTPEEAERDPSEFIKKGQGGECTYERFSFTGGKIDGKMTCTRGQQGTLEATMTGTINPELLDMTMTSTTNGAGMPGKVEMTMRMTSKRVGDCK
ncbi:DUF3617 domain-containing protein [Sphingomonas colocasiae]|uniref:DUF3617 domain-containing protein n=1 Tax=Sphingomonas colocasiae TaxID=1848973 RepID=A0ABS7PLY2_9SPHN|nr:DUF3617 domain-containing protein [Sphingomonas colocasiae]MBY8822325.1 DUF3617 domain-containing protein [Sphingomonas colocasiae]